MATFTLIHGEADARQAKQGSWQDVNPMPPWNFSTTLKQLPSTKVDR